MLREPWVHTILAILATASIAWLLYVRSTRHLRQEADELRRMTGILLRGMERAGWVTVRQTPKGRVVELIIGEGHIAPPATIQGVAHVTPRLEPSKTQTLDW